MSMTESGQEKPVDSASSLADHIDRMRADLAGKREGWENVTLEDYLEAFTAVLRDLQGKGLGGQSLMLEGHEKGSIPYAVLARLFGAAAVYD